MKKISETNQFTHTVVLYLNNERVVHLFVDGGSQVELASQSDGVFGSGILYQVEHEDGVAPSEVLRFLSLNRFLEPQLVA